MFLLVCLGCLRAARVNPQDESKVALHERGITLNSECKCPDCQRQYMTGALMYGIKIIPLKELGVIKGDVTNSCIVAGDDNFVNNIRVNYRDDQPSSLTVNGVSVTIMSDSWIF